MSDLIDRQSVLNAFDYWVKSPMISYTNGLVRLREMFEELPPVTQEPCTDAISREDALMALTGEWKESLIEILPKAIKRINELPPVNPAEKMGRWIDADVLDKIRAEIEEYRDTMPWESKSLVKWEAINYILEQIIDKYKASPTGEEDK